MIKKFLITGVALLWVTFLVGQSKPFPQNINYSYGIKPTTVTSTDAKTIYNDWKNTHIKDCQGMKRVAYMDATETCSEGTGYGMLMAAYYADKALYDGLLYFYKSKLTSEAGGLMAWRVTCDGFVDKNSATDGDIDVAFSLLVANAQWGSAGTFNYLIEAKAILNIIKDKFVDNCNGIYTIKPGYGWGGCSLTDVSYYAPGYFRLFADLMSDSFWDDLADNTYYHLWRSYERDNNNVLVPDWQNSDGVPGGSGRADWYGWDASRVPWRMAMDYIWNGNTNAGNWCVNVSNWANGIGPGNIKSAYNLDGTHNTSVPSNNYNASCFVGGLACGAMCNTNTGIVNSFADHLVAQNSDKSYYNHTLRALYMLMLTGNFWEPSLAGGSDTDNGNDQGSGNDAPIGSTIWLKANINNKYVCAELNTTNAPLEADRSSVGAWEQFKIVDAGGGLMAIQAQANGKYVCADNISADRPLVANRSSIGGWEKFTWVDAGNGLIALKANANGKFICAEGTTDRPLEADRGSIGDWEKFSWGTVNNKSATSAISYGKAEFKVYPNPSNSGMFNIEIIESNHSGTLQIYLYDIQGKQVYNKTELYKSSKIVIDNNLKKGVYFLKVKSDYSTQTEKLIVN